jgi:PKD domain./Calx-beta domain.
MRPARLPRRRAGLFLLPFVLFLATSCSRRASDPAALSVPATAPDLPTAADPGELRERLASRSPALASDAAALAAPLNAFVAWAATYAAAPEAERPALLAEGLAVARSRREVMKALIEHDPELALRLAVDDATRATLPAAVTDLLEKPLAAIGRFEVDISCGLPGEHTSADASSVSAHTDTITRTLTVEGTAYRAFVYGRRAEVSTKHALPFHGIAIDDALAVAESPVRRLAPTSATPSTAADAPVPYLLGGALHEAESAAVLAELEESLAAAELIPGPEGESAASPWTEGAKTLLYIRVTFSDLPAAEPLSLATAQSHQASVATFYDENSCGKTSVATTFTPTLVLPNSEAYYNANSWTVLLADAVAAATTAGYPASNYDFYAVATKKLASMSWAGRAFIGGSGCHLNGDFALRVTAHEIGHNFGLYHANYNYTSGESPVSREALASAPENSPSQQYGHRYHMMGASGTTTAYHFSARDKYLLDWIPASDVPVILQSGVYRLYRSDHKDATGVRSLRVPAGDPVRSHFWLSYRRLFPGNAYFSSGAEVLWGRNTLVSDGTLLIDTTPFSNDGPHADSSNGDNNDKVDAALTLGRMFGSPDSGAWFTILAQGGTAPNEWLDVGVQVGNFSANRPPVPSLAPASATLAINQSLDLSASATDPDDDTVVYSWDFGDGTFAGNQTSVSKSWSTAGHYVVRLVAVDQKGGYSSARCVVRVGSPATFTASGRVLANGQPVEGVRVHNGLTGSAYRGTRTDSQGYYTIPNLALGSYTLSARKEGYVFAPAFADSATNPVAISAHTEGLDFTATTAPAPHVIVDNTDPTGVEIVANSGSWVSLSSANGFYGSDYLTDNNSSKGQKQITYRPYLPENGLYRVYFRYAQSSNRATNVPVDVSHAGGVTTFTVDQTSNGGLWNYLGTFAFAAGDSGFARIRTTNTNGHVSADAFKFELTTDQDPTVRLQTVKATASERGLSPATLRIEREGPLDFPLTVHLATDTTAEGDATPGLDFVAPPTSLTLDAQTTSADISIVPLADSLPEGPETLRVSLRQPPGPEQEWTFDEPSGSTLADAVNSVPAGISWAAPALTGTVTTGSGSLRIRYTGSAENPVSSSWAVLPAPVTAPRYLVLETTAWKWDGTSPNEAVRFAFTTGANTTLVAQAVISRAADGVYFGADALGTGATNIPASLVTPSITSGEPCTFVLALFPATKTYRISVRYGAGGAFTHLGTGNLATDRSAGAIRLSVLNSFASTSSEKFDIGRIALETADPTQPAYVIAAPSEAELVILDDPRDDWRFRRFTPTQLDNPAIGGWSADPDGDGLDNFAEYAFGRSPLVADAAGLTSVSTVTIDDARHLAIGFLRRVDDPDLEYFPEAAGDLTTPLWPDAAIQVGDPVETPDPDYEQVLFRDPQPLDTNPRRFLRVRVTAE